MVETDKLAMVETDKLATDATKVTRTTPQGTQAHAVEHGHEDRDLDVRALLKWIVGLFVLAGLTHLAMAGMFFGLKALTTDHAAQSIPWAMMNHPVPGPRLLPNPDQGAPQVPAASMDALRTHENVGLRTYGLVDGGGEPRIPDRAVGMISPEQGPPQGSPGLDPEGLPSSASGGTRADGSR